MAVGNSKKFEQLNLKVLLNTTQAVKGTFVWTPPSELYPGRPQLKPTGNRAGPEQLTKRKNHQIEESKARKKC